MKDLSDLNSIRDENDLIAYGNRYFERSAKAKRKSEMQWLLNIAFIAGDQLVSVNKYTGSLDRINVEFDPDWVVRTVDNRILPVYRLLMAKLTKNKPMPAAKAHSREESDIQAARAAIKLEECHWSTLELDEIHPEMIAWLVATGNCFYKQFWNSQKGDRVIDLREMDTEAGLTEQGLPIMKAGAREEKYEFQLGDTDLILRSPFHCYPQPGKTRIADMKMFGDAEIMDVDEIYDLYNVEVAPEKDNKYVRIHTRIDNALQAGYIEESTEENAATVKELSIMPCKKFPKGFVFSWARDKMLYYREECQEIPFTHFGLIKVPGRFWHKGVVEDLIPIQRRWNTLLSKIEMHNDYYNDPPVLVDTNIIDPEEWYGEPGLMIPKKRTSSPGEAVEVVRVPQLDQAIFEEIKILDQQFELVPVLNKVSYGKDTPNATSGIAINFLQEKDDDVVRPLVDIIEAGYAKVFKRDFKLCQDNYEEDRGFAIVGEDNKMEWVEFKKADLESNIDVGVEPGSAMPRSKVAQQALVLDMLEKGFFTDQRTGRPDFAKALKYMEFGSVDDIYKDAALDANQAGRENEAMKDGRPTMPEDWHNHEAHIYEHDRLRKTADYENLPDEIKQLFNVHIEAHKQFMGQGQQPAQPSQPEQPGQPVAAGGAENPIAKQMVVFLDQLMRTNPELFKQLMELPREQQGAEIMRLFQESMAGEETQPPAMA